MTQTITGHKFDFRRTVNIALYVCAALAAAIALVLTFTVGDYYIFSRFSEYGFFFCISQWFKKAGLLLILAAVFFNCKSCADAVKYFLPLFVILSCCLFGGFFDIVPPVPEDKPAQEIFNKINLGFPKGLNMALFFIQNALYLACCALLFVRDGYKVRAKSFITLPFALLLTLPLNIFENFFDINKVPANSFLRFKNFTLWHFLALCVLVGSTVGAYCFLKNKTRRQQDKYLAVMAVSLLIQYHSKDSMVMGDGYNVYYTVFACLPLFICNIGVYVASISVILKKRALYAISFFIHAVGALTVFIYFGKDSMSNYGIFASHSILYFCLTHIFLFVLCVLPSALGHYKFKIKDCIIPLVYYCIVIILAAVASALVTEFLTNMGLSVGSAPTDDMTPPNYAFTQVNPLPFEVPNLIPLGGAFRHINVFYVILVYIAYVCLFFAFYGAYRAYLAVRKVVLTKIAERKATAPEAPAVPEAVEVGGLAEIAAADEGADENAEAAEEKDEPSEESAPV